MYSIMIASPSRELEVGLLSWKVSRKLFTIQEVIGWKNLLHNWYTHIRIHRVMPSPFVLTYVRTYVRKYIYMSTNIVMQLAF